MQEGSMDVEDDHDRDIHLSSRNGAPATHDHRHKHAQSNFNARRAVVLASLDIHALQTAWVYFTDKFQSTLQQVSVSSVSSSSINLSNFEWQQQHMNVLMQHRLHSKFIDWACLQIQEASIELCALPFLENILVITQQFQANPTHSSTSNFTNVSHDRLHHLYQTFPQALNTLSKRSLALYQVALLLCPIDRTVDIPQKYLTLQSTLFTSFLDRSLSNSLHLYFYVHFRLYERIHFTREPEDEIESNKWIWEATDEDVHIQLDRFSQSCLNIWNFIAPTDSSIFQSNSFISQPFLVEIFSRLLDEKVTALHSQKDTEEDSFPLLLTWFRSVIIPFLALLFPPNRLFEVATISRILFHYAIQHFTQDLFNLLFDIIIDYPTSLSALKSLPPLLKLSDTYSSLVSTLSNSFTKRLLQPGANTSDILSTYVNTLLTLRSIDRTGLLWLRINPQLQKYIRQRSDSIRTITRMLVGKSSTSMDKNNTIYITSQSLEEGSDKSDVLDISGELDRYDEDAGDESDAEGEAELKVRKRREVLDRKYREEQSAAYESLVEWNNAMEIWENALKNAKLSAAPTIKFMDSDDELTSSNINNNRELLDQFCDRLAEVLSAHPPSSSSSLFMSSNSFLFPLPQMMPLDADEIWQPDPLDAHPTSTSRSGRHADIITDVLSIHASDVLKSSALLEPYMEDYKSLLRDRLLTSINYECDEEIIRNERMVNRFGEESMIACEIMIRDMENSRRIHAAVLKSLDPWNVEDVLLAEAALKKLEEGFVDLEAADSKTLTLATKTTEGWSHAKATLSSIHFEVFILSNEYWPEFPRETYSLPSTIGTLFRLFSVAYTKLKAPRQLTWLPLVGCVDIELELSDRTLELSVSPLHFTILSAFQSRGRMKASDLMEECGIEDFSFFRTNVQYWLRLNVLREQLLTNSGISNSTTLNPDQIEYEIIEILSSDDINYEDGYDEDAANTDGSNPIEPNASLHYYILSALSIFQSLPLSLSRLHAQLRSIQQPDFTYRLSEHELHDELS